MIEFNRLTHIGSDETAVYEVILDKEYTVSSFLDTVLSRKGEWGNFIVIGYSYSEYKHGQLLYKLTKECLTKKVIKVDAVGGWSRMDYRITVAN